MDKKQKLNQQEEHVFIFQNLCGDFSATIKIH